MKVVCDANILVRAAWSENGPAAALLVILSEAPHELICSRALLDEVERILKSPRLRTRHGWDDEKIELFASRMESLAALVVVPVNPPPVVAGDPMDDHVVYAAQSGGADAICTRDQHLFAAQVVDYCRSFNTRVLTELELLAELRGETEQQ